MIAIYRLGEGVQAFPCSENLAFGCQARGAFPFPVPKRWSNKDHSFQLFPFPIICRPHLYTAPVVAARTRPVAAAGCIGSHLNDLILYSTCFAASSPNLYQNFHQTLTHPFAVQVAEDEGCAEEVSEEDWHREGLF